MKKYFFLFLAVVLAGCSGFLEPQSQSEFVPEDAVSLNEMLLGEAYPAGSASDKPLLSLDAIFDDDLVCADNQGTNTVNANLYIGYRALFSWQPDVFVTLKQQGGYLPVWENHYLRIRGANAALDYIDEVTGSVEEKALVKAQAYALRAFYYFRLVNLWGRPYTENKEASGVPLKLTSAMENRELARNTVEEVYRQILTDLNQAEALYLSVPKEKQYRKDNRTSLPMVQLLKSRVYLYMEDWKNCAIYAKKVIDDWDFELLDLNTVRTTNRVPYYNFISLSSPETIWLYGNISDFTKITNAYVFLPEERPNVTAKTVRKFNASPELLKEFQEGDLRKQHYIIQEYKFPEVYLAYGKFNVTSQHAPVSEGTELFAMAMRLSEAYLNLAEAAANLKDDGIALQALNALREKRFQSGKCELLSGLSGQALIDRVRLERRLELCFEGHRWQDLRRWGMPAFSRVWKDGGQNVATYTLLEKDPFYALPIPQVVMERNRSLVQNELSNPR